MSNSNLVSYTKISPNCNKPRADQIRKITIHHMAGNMTVEQCGDLFANPTRQASSNYGIGSNGKIALYVEEANRAWTSGNGENDHQAITIEVANDGGSPAWHVSDAAMESLIALCVDVCKRNGIEKLNFTGDKTGNLTMHKYFQATACPGPYLESQFPWIAQQVNKRLSPEVAEEVYTVKPGDTLSGIATKYGTTFQELAEYNGISNPNLIYPEQKIKIPAVKKAESGNKATAFATIKAGSTVRLKQGAKDCGGKGLAAFVYNRDHKVLEIKADRAVIAFEGKVVAAVRAEDLYLV